MTKHPFRDGLILSLVLAALIVLISWLTGGDLGRAFVFAAGYFVVATAWTWWRLRRRTGREQT
ncbi:MAG: hypothetical protein M3R12_06260 [Actinomycetota bacterium]|nr:hypothetical protein [Actinomycetota bacterium]